ncbi:MAG: hypothetical protein AVDCRST_MAG62-602 [uncultured Sphingomonas sp.]|uniref:Uncharacterized protein n=1 Tax=uncultured Sphingomonas sp. TaxID=158754 RepID=A0A6J4T3K9_9SPHN|nr:MAG: hypothetical protein AVDCRST_MAG62-602 [uncultured Sphingomonas sp.]
MLHSAGHVGAVRLHGRSYCLSRHGKRRQCERQERQQGDPRPHPTAR